jgi:hypothetical protein
MEDPFETLDFEVGEDGSNTIPYGSFDFEGVSYRVELELFHNATPEVWVFRVGEGSGLIDDAFYSYDTEPTLMARQLEALNAHMLKMTGLSDHIAEHDGIDFILFQRVAA